MIQTSNLPTKFGITDGICIFLSLNKLEEMNYPMWNHIFKVLCQKYSLDFAVDSVTCQNLPNIGWCIVVQLNYSKLAKFNRLARQQEVSKPDDFHDEDEVF